MTLNHDPANKVFDWLCQRNNILVSSRSDAAAKMKEFVYKARRSLHNPLSNHISYGDAQFRAAYLMAYFPYYIEPVYSALILAGIPNSYFERENLNVALLGGGPCPEILGLAAYLREQAPKLKRVDATSFDRQLGWQLSQLSLIPSMLPSYCAPNTSIHLCSKQCDLIECATRNCHCRIFDMDIVLAQNFLTEIHKAKINAMESFERLLTRSRCNYIVFVDNFYPEVKLLLDELYNYLNSRGLIKNKLCSGTTTIRPKFNLPDIVQRHLFVNEDYLRAKRKVNFHYMVLEIDR